MPIEKGSLGNAIRNARIKRSISQEALAELVGITPTHLKHIESEHRKPSIEVLIEIAQTLQMSVDNIIFPQESELNLKLNELENSLSNCTLNELQIMLDVLHSLKRNMSNNTMSQTAPPSDDC